MAPKRPSSPTLGSSDGAASKVTANAQRERGGRAEGGIDERGQFEDQWEDEFEEEDVDFDNQEDDDDDDEDDDSHMGESRETGMEGDVDAMGIANGANEEDERLPYLPGLGQGDKLAEDEELVADLSTYVFLHHARLTWPCLSFDILRDDLGESRMKPPHSACLVAGTQADATGGPSSANEIAIMKFDNLTRTKANRDEEDSDQSDDEDDEEEEGANDEDAVMTYRSIPHAGGVNRIRAQQMPMPYSSPAPQPPNGNYHVATFSETGKVHIFDIAPHLASLQHPSTFSGANLNNKPVYTVESHKRAEGFALAWSPQLPNSDMTRLLSGDIHSKIYMTNMTQSGFETSSGVPFASHTSSIEDIQWSPTEKTVFGSVSADRSMRIWDIRVRDRKSVLAATEAHDSDINVMSWNTGASANYLIITGGDEGGIKVWDLRNMKGGKGGKTNATPVASFDWHKAPITSIEWHPTEDSCFAAASADDTVTLWDLSVELDEEEKGQQNARADKTKDVPPQLLFVHAGQKEVKELHWHPQIPGSVITTSLDNFAVFKTISL